MSSNFDKYTFLCSKWKITLEKGQNWSLCSFKFAYWIDTFLSFISKIWSKHTNSIILFEPQLHRLKVIQKPWALGSKQIWNRSFKWGTKHWFWSRGCKDIRGQSWSSKKYLPTRPTPGARVQTGPIGRYFSELQLWLMGTLQPLDKNGCIVPHLKDLFHICLGIKAQSIWMTFNICNLGSK